LDSRASEIDRLTALLDGGRPYDVVALEARNRSNERLISHLNIQIDYLQQKNAELQKELDGLSTLRTRTTTSLDRRNLELTKELQDVDMLAQQLQKEKEKIISAADRDLRQAKMETEKVRSQLLLVESDMEKLRTEYNDCLLELEDSKKQLTSQRAGTQHLDDLIDKLQQDKKRLGLRVNKLTALEKDLVLEIDRLRHHHKNGSVQPGKQRTKSASGPTEAFIKGLEDELYYWKSQVDDLQQIIRSRPASSGSRTTGTATTSTLGSSRSRSTSPSRQVQQSSRTAASPTRGKTVSRATSPVTPTKKTSGQFDSIIRALEDERDHYKQECELLKATSRSSRPTSPSRLNASREKSAAEESEIALLRQERDELQGLLDKFERHMAEIQANVRVLTQERDNVNALYTETKEELARLRREVVRSPKSVKSSLAAQAVLRRVENERDDALANVHNLTIERDTLRERLKIATESQLADRARLEQTIEDLENAVRAMELERKSADDRLRRTETYGTSLEEQVREQASQLADARDKESQHRTTAAQMRLLADQAERVLKDQQTVLENKEADLRALQEHIHMLEDQITSLKRVAQCDRDELAKLRSTVATLDHEKDELQMAVDEKTEMEVSRSEAIAARERMLTEMRSSIADLESIVERLKETVASKDREILSLRRQLDANCEELTEAGRGREIALRENRRIQDDMAMMTRENQSLHAELNEAIQEKEELKRQMQDYIIEVKRCQELLSAKERERTDILEQYRSLSQTAERYETQAHHLESEGSNLKLELLTRDSEIRRLREKTESLDRQLQEHLSAERTFEVQLSNANRSAAGMEDLLRNVEQEKHNLMLDLAAARDLCSRLESAKDGLQRQLVSKALDQEKLQALLEDVRHETDVLRTQLNNERATKQGLEGLLQDNHTKGWQIELGIQEKETEIQLLKDRLALNESKIESQTRELNQNRTRLIEVDSELERLKRQLISERFERERCVQELRRNGLTPPNELSGSRLGSISPNRSRDRSPSARQSPSIHSPAASNASA
jgi:centrosomal protein CEP135